MKIEKKKFHQIDKNGMDKGDVSIIPGGHFQVFCLKVMITDGSFLRIMIGKKNEDADLRLINLGSTINDYADKDYYILEDK